MAGLQIEVEETATLGTHPRGKCLIFSIQIWVYRKSWSRSMKMLKDIHPFFMPANTIMVHCDRSLRSPHCTAWMPMPLQWDRLKCTQVTHMPLLPERTFARSFHSLWEMQCEYLNNPGQSSTLWYYERYKADMCWLGFMTSIPVQLVVQLVFQSNWQSYPMVPMVLNYLIHWTDWSPAKMVQGYTSVTIHQDSQFTLDPPVSTAL